MIAIVGVLAGFIFISMNNAIVSAQDAKRKADLSTIQKAILMYQAGGGTLSAGSGCTIGDTGCIGDPANNILADYLKKMPTDSDSSKHYTYTLSGSDFTIQTTLSTGGTYSYNTASGWSESSNPLLGWTHKKQITLNNTSGSTLTDYQIKLTIKKNGDSNDSDCDNFCNNDFSDLRFVSGGTIFKYWIESKVDGSTATIWVKVPSIPTGSSSFYMYYGNTSATSLSNGDDTFLLFEDFSAGTLNGSKWTTANLRGTYSIGSNQITFNVSSSTWWGIYIGSVAHFPKANKYLLNFHKTRANCYGGGATDVVAACSYSNTVSRDTTYYYKPEVSLASTHTCVWLHDTSCATNSDFSIPVDVSAEPTITQSNFDLEFGASNYNNYPMSYSKIFLCNYVSSGLAAPTFGTDGPA